MTFNQITEKIRKNKGVYFKSPRWKNKRVVYIFDTPTLGLVSVDYTSDEGFIGNTREEIEFGNRSGRFLNQEEELWQNDFEITTLKDAQMKIEEYAQMWH